MTQRVSGLAVAALLIIGFVQSVTRAQSQTAAPQAPQPVFRTNTDFVTIPVFVKGTDGIVGTLQASDFLLTDNGVPQKVETLDSESFPVDVTLLIETDHAIEDYRKTLNEQVRKIAALMRPTDRIEIVAIDNYVEVLVPFGPPTRSLAVDVFTGGGMASVNDAIVAALLRQPDPDRRHLIIAMTDTIDTMSTTTMATIREVAKQASATLVVSWITLSQDDENMPMRGQTMPPPKWMTSTEKVERYIRTASPTHRTVPKRQQWTPHYTPPIGRFWEAFAPLREAAELTGGSVHPPGVFTDRNAAAIFDKIYAEFRQNYILRFLPQGVAREGWHDVTVTIPSHRGFDVRARRGYLVESASAAKPASVPASTPKTPALTTLIDAVNRHDAVSVSAAVAVADLAALLKSFQTAGNISPAEPRREFVAALALADAAIASRSPEFIDAGVKLLARYTVLVRSPIGPDEFEREWLERSTWLLASVADPLKTWPALTAAVNRFPNDPQILLARAVVGDQFISGLPGSPGTRTASPQALDQALGFFDSASNDSSVAQEARLRKAGLLKRLGRDTDARVLLAAISASADSDSRQRAWLKLIDTTPAASVGGLNDDGWRAYWSGDRRVSREQLDHLLRMIGSK